MHAEDTVLRHPFLVFCLDNLSTNPILPPMSFHVHHRPRRLLLDGGRSDYGRAASFDANMVIILAALLCALVCALGINSIVRCMLRCAARMNPAAGEALPGKGLTKAALSRIQVAVYGSEQGAGSTDCPICLGEFSGGDKIRVLPKCRHFFHVKCVDVWLASHSSCPTCRRSLAEDHGGDAVAEGGGRQPGHGDTTPAAEEVG